MFEMDWTAAERAKAYEFLAEIFLQEPDKEGITRLKSWAHGNEQALLSLLEKIEAQDQELTVLCQEYYDLFFVPVSGRFVPPFESAVRNALRKDGEKTKFGRLLGDETALVDALYRQTEFFPGRLPVFDPLKQLNVPDHLGFELAYMAYLCRLEEERVVKGLQTGPIRMLEEQFLGSHLNQWLSLLVGDLSRMEQSGYFMYFVEQARDLCLEEEKVLHLAQSSERSDESGREKETLRNGH